MTHHHTLTHSKNDCAVTVDPIGGKWYLLETIPGTRFRTLVEELGIQPARAYFRKIVDERRLGRHGRLKDLLGVDDTKHDCLTMMAY